MADAPMGLTEVAQMTDPWISRRTWQQWARRGYLLPAPWIVNGAPAWPMSDVAHMLATIPLHWPYDAEGSPVRCGAHACEHCADGAVPESWSAYWARLEQRYSHETA
jgi:hypothetical protein